MNTKKNVPTPISITIAVTAISRVIESAAKAARTVPAEPKRRHLAYLQKQPELSERISLLEFIKPAIITYISTAAPSAKATQIPVKISGVKPSAKIIAIIIPNIIPKMAPVIPHPLLHGQQSLFFFIFINS